MPFLRERSFRFISNDLLYLLTWASLSVPMSVTRWPFKLLMRSLNFSCSVLTKRMWTKASYSTDHERGALSNVRKNWGQKIPKWVNSGIYITTFEPRASVGCTDGSVSSAAAYSAAQTYPNYAYAYYACVFCEYAYVYTCRYARIYVILNTKYNN